MSELGLDCLYQTDEAQDVLGSLRHMVSCATDARQNSHAWKWWMLAMHSAVQGACVCHLTTSAPPLGAITASNQKEWLRYFKDRRSDENVIAPDIKLMSFPALLKAVRKAKSAGDRSDGKIIEISDEELEWLSEFHTTIRNQFVHFSAMGWTIDLSGLPQLATLAGRIIGAISEYGYAFRHLACNEQTELDLLVDQIAKTELS